jgi:hypothetical protein
MAVFNLPRHADDDDPDVPVPPLVTPRLSIDGWTLAGTPLADRVPREVVSELTTLLHCASMRMETPWTYERAAELLEACGEPEQALAACEAWFALPASRGSVHAAKNRALTRRRHRLRSQLAASGTLDT